MMEVEKGSFQVYLTNNGCTRHLLGCLNLSNVLSS